MIRALEKSRQWSLCTEQAGVLWGAGVVIGLRYVVVGLLGVGLATVVGLWVPMCLLFRSVPS